MSASCSRAVVATQSSEEEEEEEEVDVSPPSNKKYSIVVDWEGVKGKDATKWSSRCGFLIRRHIPIGYEEWRKVEDCYKDNLWKELMKEFETNLEPNIARLILERKFSQYFRTVKSTLRMKYLKEDGHIVPKHVALDNRPVDIDKIWWEKFVDIEYSEKKLKQCEKNTENKAKHVIPHTLGRKSYVQLCDELAMKNPEEKLTQAIVWKLAHKSKKTGEVIPCAVEKYALIEAAETLVEEGGEKRQKFEAGSAAMRTIKTLIEALEKGKNLETGSDGMKKDKTLREAGEKRQNLEAGSDVMNKDKTLIEAGEKRQKLDAVNGGMRNFETLLEAVEKGQTLEADNDGNENLQDLGNLEKRQNLEPVDGGMRNLEALLEAVEREQTLEADNNGNENIEDLGNDSVGEVFGHEKRKSNCHEKNSTANINQVKFTHASKAATSDSEESEELRQWKIEIQDHVQTQIDDAIKLMSSKMLSMQHNMQQNILQFMNQHGGKRTLRTEVASNIERANGCVGSSRRGRQYVMLLSRDLKDVAKGYVGTQKSCHRRKVVQSGEKVVWVEEVLDPKALIYDGPQNGKYKLSEVGDGGFVIWPVFRLRDL